MTRPNQRYPLERNGGLFLTCIGTGCVVGILLRGDHPINVTAALFGAAAGVILLVFGRRWVSGSPAPLQLCALGGAIALEMVLFAALGAKMNPQTNPREWWLLALVIVGIHFLPMGLAFGRPVVILGLFCICNAGAGLYFDSLPFATVALLDGALKIGTGGLMFSHRSA
jgi:hypothetical protein